MGASRNTKQLGGFVAALENIDLSKFRRPVAKASKVTPIVSTPAPPKSLPTVVEDLPAAKVEAQEDSPAVHLPIVFPTEVKIKTFRQLRLSEEEKAAIPKTAEILSKYESERPKTREDCLKQPRPCPWVSCQHHLATDVNESTGTLYVVEDWDDGRATCTLDVVDENAEGMTLEVIGQILGVSRERVRQIEVMSLARAAKTRDASMAQDMVPAHVASNLAEES